MPITEDDALKAIQAFQMLGDQPELQAKAKQINDAYRTQQERLGAPLFPTQKRKEAEETTAIRRKFQDREKYGFNDERFKDFAQTFPTPEERTGYLNTQYLAKRFNKPVSEIRSNSTAYRDRYAVETWGEPVKTESEFYQKLGEDFDTEDQIADLAQTAALQGIPAVQAWAQVPDEIKTNPAFQRRQKALLAEFEETAAATDARISPYRQVVTQTIEDLRETMKGTPSDEEQAGAALSGGLSAMGAEAGREISGAMDFRDFAQRLVEIPKEDRDLVIAAIIAGAGEGDAKGPAQKLAENFARGVQSIAADTVGATDRLALRQLQSFANQGAGVDGDATTVQGYLQGLNARLAAASDPTGAAALAAGMSEKTAPSEEIRAQAAALIETQMEAIDVANDLQQIADGVIDPAKGEYMVTRGLYAAARSIPYTLVAMAPGGIAVNTVALSEQSYQTMRRANPDMSRDEAMAISAIAGPIQAGLEQIPAAMLAGKLPTLGRFMNQAVATRGGAATRFGVRALEGTAIEMIQENAQDLTPFAVQGAIAALSDDMPDVPWNEVYGGDFWNNQGELFFATLPLAFIGAGAGTVRDFTAARSLMHDPRAVSSIIGNEAKASEIAEAAQSGNYDKAQALLREGMREVKADRSDLMAVRQKAAAELQADAARKAATITKAEEVGVLPAIGRTAEGWSLKFNDGTARTFENHQEADAARWRYTEEAGLSVAEATRSVIQSVESQLEAGREVAFSFVNERRTLLNAVQEGEAAPEAANKRAQIAQDVGGQDITRGAEPVEIDPEQEYQEAFTAAELAAITEDDKLALFQILGSNKTEFADGVQRTTIKLFQGATPLTVIEEKLEGDASAMIAGGKRDWLLYSLIRYQRTSGDKVFREGVKSNDDISDADLKEAWSHLGQSYFVGRSRRGDVGDRWKSRNFRKAAAELLRSPVGAAMDGYARFFQSVWKRAAKLNKLRREGKLDADLERELARSVGFGEQAEYEASVETEAAALLREMEESEMTREPLEASSFEPTDDAPFSVIATGGDPSSFRSFDEDYPALSDMMDGVRNGELLVHARRLNASEVSDLEYGLEPTIGETLGSTEALQQAEELGYDPVELVFASDEFKWTGGERNGMIFIRRDGFQKSLGNGKVELPDGSVVNYERSPLADYENPALKDEPLGVETGDWYSTKTADVVGVSLLTEGDKVSSFSVITNAESRIAESFNPFLRNPEQRRRIVLEAQKRGREQASKFDEIIRRVRTAGSLSREAQVREGLEYDRLLRETFNATTPEEQDALPAVDRLAARSDAKKVAADWKKAQEQALGNIDRQLLIGAMRTLDAMTSALPSELRGSIGGMVSLAQVKGPEALVKKLEERSEKFDEVLEDWLRKEADKQLKKLFKVALPAKDEAGKLRKGKAGANIHDLFDKLRLVYAQRWTAEQAEAYAVGLESEIAKGEMSPEREAHALMEAEAVRLIGGWFDQYEDSGKVSKTGSKISVRVKGGDGLGAEARNHALDTLTEIWKSAYADYQIQKMKEKERRDGIRTELRADTGKAGKKSERALTEMAGVKLPGRARDFFLSLLNFEQLTQWAFGKESKWAQWFADEQRKAENAKLDAVQAVTEGVEDFFTELAGGNRFKGEQLQYRMMQRSLTAKAADGDIVPLSELEALSALLMWQQEDGKRHLRGKRDENGAIVSTWAYDEDFIDEISSKLSPEAWRVLGYLQGEYAKEYGPLNAVYRDIYGINLPQNANYSPLTVKPTQAPAGQTADPLTGSTVSTGSFTPGSLRSRAQVSAEPDFRDAVATFLAHKKQIEHWKAHARFVLDANAVLGNREVGNSIEAAHGQEAVKIIRKWLDAIAQGGVRSAANDTRLMQIYGNVVGRASSMALVGRIGTIAIQSTQLAAAAALMPTGAYVVRLGKLLSGNLGWGRALASPYVQTRIKQQPVMVQVAMEGLKAGKPTRIKHEVRRIGAMLNGADGLFTAGTYAMVHDYHFSKAKRDGMTDSEAEVFATETAERVVESVAQPTRMGTRSYYEISMNGPMARLVWAFASDARKNAGLLGFTYSKGNKGDFRKAVLFAVVLNSILASVIRNAWRDMRDGEDDEVFDEKYWSSKRTLLSLGTDWMGGIPAVGEEVQRAVYSLAGEYSPNGGLLSALVEAPGAAKNLIEGDSTDDLRDAEKVMNAIGLFSDNTAAATSVMHIIRDLYGLGENFLSE